MCMWCTVGESVEAMGEEMDEDFMIVEDSSESEDEEESVEVREHTIVYISLVYYHSYMYISLVHITRTYRS